MKKIITLLTMTLGIFALVGLASASTTEDSTSSADRLQPASSLVVEDELQVLGTARAYSIRIGAQGYGGVTFFNGTIINETTDVDTGAEQPVTFGDDIRVDGQLWRGENSGAGLNDNRELTVNDDMIVTGDLTVNGVLGLKDNDIPNSITVDNYLLKNGDNISGNITADAGVSIDSVDISDNTTISFDDSIGYSLWFDGLRGPVGSSTNASTGNIQAGRTFFSCRNDPDTYGNVSSTSERVVMPESFSKAFSVILTPTVPKTSLHIDFIYTAIPVSYNSFEIDTEQPSTGTCMQSSFNWVAVGY